MMRGALATTSVGNRMLFSVPSRTPGAQASKMTVRLSAEQAADAVQREAEAELDRRELRGDDDAAARSRGWPSGSRVVEDADGLDR